MVTIAAAPDAGSRDWEHISLGAGVVMIRLVPGIIYLVQVNVMKHILRLKPV